MSRTIVSIVSEQTIPNYIFIKEMFLPGDKLIFIASQNERIISKCENIINTLQWSIEPQKIIFPQKGNEENWQSIHDAITPYLSKDEQYIVNLTGGTKYMALAIEMIFSKYNSEFYYIPFPKNTILKLRANHCKSITYRTNVNEYMSLYGLPISSGELVHNKEYSQNVLELFKHLSNNEFSILEKLRAYRDTKPIKISFLETKEDTEKKPAIKGLSKFLEFISYPIKNADMIDKYDIRYITGGWFEEYVYYLIKDTLKPTDIQIGVLIRETKETNMNDLDVVFTLGNKLFVIECKTGVGGRSLFSQIVYKASALKETLLGLSGKSYIFSLSPEDVKLQNVAKNMDVTYCDKTYFEQTDKFKEIAIKISAYAND